MKLIVGLGNPGDRYAMNRHNIGFLAVERIATDHGLLPWKSRFQGQLAEGRIGAARVALLKPQTFMNLSGQSVGEAMRYLKLTPEDVVVLHDELDLAPGKCRLKLGGGHAGHNGLRSIHQHVGPEYQRVRLGIGHPGHKDRVAAYVLSDFAKAEQDWLEDLLRGISDGAEALAMGDGARFQNAVAARMAPPKRTAAGTGAAAARSAMAGRAPGGADDAAPRHDKSDAASAGKTLPDAPGQKNEAAAPSWADRLKALGDRFR